MAVGDRHAGAKTKKAVAGPTAKLDALLAEIEREAGEYADHAPHVGLGAYQAHAKVRDLARRARRHLSPAPKKPTASAQRAYDDLRARRAAETQPTKKEVRRVRAYLDAKTAKSPAKSKTVSKQSKTTIGRKRRKGT